MSNATHTPGPWRWEYNPDRKKLALLGGVPRYDLTLLDFVRSGMQGGIARFRDPAFPGMNVMELPGKWAVTQKGRERHADWFKLIDHPDANLIAAAPTLLDALKLARAEIAWWVGEHGCCAGKESESLAKINAAIALAEGGAK